MLQEEEGDVLEARFDKFPHENLTHLTIYQG